MSEHVPNDTLPLWAGEGMAKARKTDPETSHEAAASLSGEKLRRSQALVLEMFRGTWGHEEWGGFSVYGLADVHLVEEAEEKGLGLSRSRIRTARNELVKAGYVCDTGEKIQIGKTQHTVWALTIEGRELTEEGSVKNLYEVRVEFTVYVVAESGGMAELEATSFEARDEMDNAHLSAFLIEDEDQIERPWRDSFPYGYGKDDDPNMTCVEFIQHEASHPPTDTELEDLGQMTLA